MNLIPVKKIYNLFPKIFFDLVLPPLPQPFVLPDKLANLNNNKIVYVSVGSWSSAYKPLMEHIVDVIAQLPYRFILSSGVLGNL